MSPALAAKKQLHEVKQQLHEVARRMAETGAEVARCSGMDATGLAAADDATWRTRCYGYARRTMPEPQWSGPMGAGTSPMRLPELLLG